MDYFLLDAKTGELRTAKPLDKEALPDDTGLIILTVKVILHCIAPNRNRLKNIHSVGTWIDRRCSWKWSIDGNRDTGVCYNSWCKRFPTNVQQKRIFRIVARKYNTRNTFTNCNECAWPRCGEFNNPAAIQIQIFKHIFAINIPRARMPNSLYVLRMFPAYLM